MIKFGNAGPKWYQAFLWKVSHERLMTNVERMKRHMASTDMCPRCNICPETVMHVLRDCEDVQDFSKAQIHPDHVSRFLSLGLHGWLDFNLCTPNVGLDDINWQLYFGVSLYELWRDRNRLVFDRNTSLGEDLRRFLVNESRFISHSGDKFGLSHDVHQKRVTHIGWVPPTDGCVKVNTDGAHNRSGISSCGGLLWWSNP